METPPADVCRQLCVSEAIFYIWKKNGLCALADGRAFSSVDRGGSKPDASCSACSRRRQSPSATVCVDRNEREMISTRE